MATTERRVTASDIRLEEVRIRALVEEVVALFSLQPHDSPTHQVEAYLDGFRVLVDAFSETLYVYALPWSRGWSIFTTTPDDIVGAYSWRYVYSRLKGLQAPVYNPRGTSGPWRVSASDLAGAVLKLVDHIERLGRLRRERFARKHWYWPLSAAAKKGS